MIEREPIKGHFEKHPYQTLYNADWNFNVHPGDQPELKKVVNTHSKLFEGRTDMFHEPVPPYGIHATILRVGLVDDFTKEQMTTIADKIEKRLKDFSMPESQLGDWWFKRARPVVNIEPQEPWQKLAEIVKDEVQKGLGEKGIPDNTPEFTPHIAFAYMKNHTAEHEAEACEIFRAHPVKGTKFTVTSLDLIKQKHNGAYYYPEETVKKIPIGTKEQEETP